MSAETVSLSARGEALPWAAGHGPESTHDMVATCSVPSGQAVAVESPETMAVFDSTDVIQQQILCAWIINGCTGGQIGDAHGGVDSSLACGPRLPEQDSHRNFISPAAAASAADAQCVGACGSCTYEAGACGSLALMAASTSAEQVAGSTIGSHAQAASIESLDATGEVTGGLRTICVLRVAVGVSDATDRVDARARASTLAAKLAELACEIGGDDVLGDVCRAAAALLDAQCGVGRPVCVHTTLPPGGRVAGATCASPVSVASALGAGNSSPDAHDGGSLRTLDSELDAALADASIEAHDFRALSRAALDAAVAASLAEERDSGESSTGEHAACEPSWLIEAHETLFSKDPHDVGTLGSPAHMVAVCSVGSRSLRVRP